MSAHPPRWYTAAWLLALPVAALYLCWRGVRQPEYLRHWRERFLGSVRSGEAAPEGAIWIHAVSVGETRAAQPLLVQLARAHAQAAFVLTHMTPTGRAAGAELAQALPGRVRQRYLPYDVPWAVRRFLRETRPRIGILMETEIWPNLLAEARAARVPVVLASARLSQRSLDKGLRYARLMRSAAACVSAVGAQTQADAERISRLYTGPVLVTGNVKFDLLPDPAQLEQGRRLRARLQPGGGAPRGTASTGGSSSRPLWLFASTREGEERVLIEALRARGAWPRREGGAAAGADLPLLLFVPRHPQRFEEVAGLLRASGATVWRRAQWEDALQSAAPPGPDVVLLGDSMGEMPLYYAMADVALIGGSLLPLGGQNLIEACACGCPVVFGPHMFNFAQAANDAQAAGAACGVSDAPAALEAMARLAADEPRRRVMAGAALAYAQAHRGATARTVALIEEILAGGS